MRTDPGSRGFSLLELSVVLCAAALIAGAVVPSFIRSVQIDAARKTALEIAQVQEACRAFHVKQKFWPADLAALKAGGYLDDLWSGVNPFGKVYSLEQRGQTLSVKTEVPKEMDQVMVNILPMAAINGTLIVSAVTRPGIDPEHLPVGAVIPWPSEDIPSGWMLCDGRSVSRTDHPELFAVIGTVYGARAGAGSFNVPDLRGRTIVGRDNMGGSAANVIQGVWARQLGGVAGEEMHTLVTAEMPSHRHYGFGENIPGWPNGAQGPNNNQGPDSADYDNYLLGTTPAGGDRPHNNMQPSMAMNWIIKG
jgi:microcystin-dependent protein/competence protein ComGC